MEGMDWVLLTVVQRRNVDGGVTSLHKSREGEAWVSLRQDEGCALFLNDRVVWHDLSPVWSADGRALGVCDVVRGTNAREGSPFVRGAGVIYLLAECWACKRSWQMLFSRFPPVCELSRQRAAHVCREIVNSLPRRIARS